MSDADGTNTFTLRQRPPRRPEKRRRACDRPPDEPAPPSSEHLDGVSGRWGRVLGRWCKATLIEGRGGDLTEQGKPSVAMETVTLIPVFQQKEKRTDVLPVEDASDAGPAPLALQEVEVVVVVGVRLATVAGTQHGGFL